MRIVESTGGSLNYNLAAKDVTTDQTESIKPCTTAEATKWEQKARTNYLSHPVLEHTGPFLFITICIM